jgi:lysozyme
MMTTAQLITEIQAEEGFRSLPYQDEGGVWTQGYGETHGVTAESPPVTKAEAEQALLRTLAAKCAGLDHAIPWWRELDDVRQDVLADMAFNLGVQGVLKFKATLAACRAGSWAHASGQMLMSEWAGEVGQRAVRLAAMMRTGARP